MKTSLVVVSFFSINNVGTQEEKREERYVVQGHRDKKKDSLIHNSYTLGHGSTGIF